MPTNRADFQVTNLPWPADPAATAAAWAASDELAWLDCAAPHPWHSGSRYSLLARRPLAHLTQHAGGAAELRVAGRTISAAPDGWVLWRSVQAPPTPEKLPGCPGPGWIGYVGFEMARYLERLPASHDDTLDLPLLRMAFCDRVVLLDHSARRCWGLRAVRLPEPFASCAARHDDDWLAAWSGAVRAPRESSEACPRLVYEMPRQVFEDAVRRALDYIAAGDIYQVNLAQRLRIENVGDVLALYAAGRAANPARYGALLRWGDAAVLSFSPELFLETRGAAVLTRPIKGTRPRSGESLADRARRRELLTSPKEAAELAMIIDLHRNDLGRVCVPGSIRVPRRRRLEAHPSVFHTVADVVGTLAPGRTPLDLLAACFPAGSVTGVPKIRALQIIDELEPVARGVYTGAVGALGLDGQMTFNVAIRTVQVRGNGASLHVGGGIVAESQPAAEYDETLAKAQGILRGVLGRQVAESPALEALR